MVQRRLTTESQSQENVAHDHGTGRVREAAAYADYARALDRRKQFQEALDVLYRGKWIILLVFAIGTGAVAWYNFRLAHEFESSALLLVNPRQSNFDSSVPFGDGSLFARSDRSLSNELVVIRNSLSIARGAAERLIAMAVVPETTTPLPILGGDASPGIEEVARRLQWGYVRIAPEGRDVDIIRVTAVSPMPDEAALVANLYAEEYVRLTQEASRARIHASRAFLERQEDVRRIELREIEERIRDYMSIEGAVALDSEGQYLVAQISQLEAGRDDARIELQMQQASLATLESELADISPQLAQRMASGVEREIVAAQERIAELEVTRQQIFLRNPELADDPSGDARLRETNQQIAQLRGKIAELSQQYVREVLAVGGIDLSVSGGGLAHVAELNRQVVSARIAISGQRARLEVMDRRLEVYEVELRSLPAQTIQLAQLHRAQQAAERMYVNVVDKLQEARIAEESEIGYAAVIREALVPSVPVRPNRRKNIMLGSFLALVFGIGLATLRKRMDTKIYAPDDLRERGVSVIGVVPRMNRLIRKHYKGSAKTPFDGHMVSTRLLTLLQPTFVVSEAYRHIRTNIQFSRPDTVVQTILVTSPNPGEGKSVTALNLGIIMAQAGRRTLVIDADMRRPSVHEQLGLRREPGLVEMLFSEHGFTLEQMATRIDDLYIITAGKTVPNPAELLGSKRMRDLIAALKEHFDVIVFDTPPVFMATDAVVLSTQCDATILVTMAGSTKDTEHDHCLDVLGGVGATVIGTLLNQFEPSRAGIYRNKYRYYGGYYSRYGYGYVPGEDVPKERKRNWFRRRAK